MKYDKLLEYVVLCNYNNIKLVRYYEINIFLILFYIVTYFNELVSMILFC